MKTMTGKKLATRQLLTMLVPAGFFVLSGCVSWRPLPPVRVEVDANKGVALNGTPVSPRELSLQLQGRKRYPADYFPVIVAGVEKLDGSQARRLVEAIVGGSTIDIRIECQGLETKVLVETTIPVPDGRFNDLELVVEAQSGSGAAACRIYFHFEEKWVSELVSLDQLGLRLRQATATHTISLNDKTYAIEEREMWFQDKAGDGPRKIHPLVGVSWHPNASMREVCEVLAMCKRVGLGNLAPIQLSDGPAEEPDVEPPN